MISIDNNELIKVKWQGSSPTQGHYIKTERGGCFMYCIETNKRKSSKMKKQKNNNYKVAHWTGEKNEWT